MLKKKESFFICTVNHEPGVLEKISEVFAKLSINIKTISAAPDYNQSRSTIVIVSEESDVSPKTIEKHVRERVDFIIVEDAESGDIYERELALVCVKCDSGHTARLMQTAEVFNASVLGVGRESMTFEVTGPPEKIDGFINSAVDFGIIRQSRTGRAAMVKEEIS